MVGSGELREPEQKELRVIQRGDPYPLTDPQPYRAIPALPALCVQTPDGVMACDGFPGRDGS